MIEEGRVREVGEGAKGEERREEETREDRE